MSETFEIRSKSFAVKWIEVPSNSQVKWKIRPLKNSINLGFYQQKSDDLQSPTSNQRPPQVPSPLQKSSPSLNSTSLTSLDASFNGLLENSNLNEVNEIPHRFFSQLPSSASSLPRTGSAHHRKNSHSVNGVDNVQYSLEEKLDRHLIKKSWIGKCPADSIKTGSLNIQNGGLYAFIFDNTFSKTKAKTIIFEYSIKSNDISNNNLDLNGVENNTHQTVKFDALPNDSVYGITTKIINVKGVQYLEGYLLKKRRRKGGKNFIKRFFSLNLTYSILYYYSNNKSNTIRGSMMITQTVISADSSDRMLYLDSGMEQWILKATNTKDFNTWVNAFNFVKTQNKKLTEKMQKRAITIDSLLSDDNMTDDDDSYHDNSENFVDASERASRFSGNKVNPQFQIVEDQIQKLKELVAGVIDKEKYDDISSSSLSSISGNSNFKGYAQHQTAQQPTSTSTSTIGSARGRRPSKPLTLESVSLANGGQHTQLNMPARKPSFLHRLKKKGSQSVPSTPDRQIFDVDKLPSDNESRSNSISSASSIPIIEQQSCVNRKISLLNTIFETVLNLETEYNELVEQETGRLRSQSRIPLTRSNTNTKSLLSQEFYDAQEFADETDIGVVMLNNTSDENIDNINIDEDIRKSELSSGIFRNDLEKVNYEDVSSSSSSSDEEQEEQQINNTISNDESLESLEHDLYPLPYNNKYEFRNDIKPAACEPPSLISILRKGIGKDITSMAMPISTNEPLSFLQKYTETLEYSNMINEAMKSPIETGERILRISAFAISFISSYKDKIRSVRKPFNPLLGETFELIRPDLNVRVLTEKVIHKPFVMAAHVDSNAWYIDHAICPQQKFYGKTAEISVDGTLKLKFRNSDDIYEWNQPTTTLRNVVSLTGEKYTEPTENITIKSNTGFKCIVAFIPENGRFTSSRSEKVELKVYSEGKTGKSLSLTAKGSWTNEITLSNNKVIWKINPELENHEKKYGFTRFSCSLNHIDEVHKDCSPTDSRRRPDQKLYENGSVDEADELKLKLEEDQRLRRKDSNGNAVEHKPQFFERGSNDLDWKFIRGSKGYWNRRKIDDWDDLIKLW